MTAPVPTRDLAAIIADECIADDADVATLKAAAARLEALEAALREEREIADLLWMYYLLVLPADKHARVKAHFASRAALGSEAAIDRRKVAAYDAARAVVKIEGNTRAYYVLRAEAAEARAVAAETRLAEAEDKLVTATDVLRVIADSDPLSWAAFRARSFLELVGGGSEAARPEPPMVPCTCHYEDDPYCPRHTPLPGETARPEEKT